MNRIEKGKKQLSIFGIVLLALAGLFLILGVLGIVFGVVGEKINYVLLVFGIIGVLLSLAAIVYGVTFVWTSKALVATDGNLHDDNSLAKGTRGVVKCQKCGEPLDANGECPNHKKNI